jgi:type IV secretion system protein TrbI
VSRYVQAGSVIAAGLITGMRSDFPGEVTAQVTENIYDSPTGRYLLIPQGSKLIGTYDSQVALPIAK